MTKKNFKTSVLSTLLLMICNTNTSQDSIPKPNNHIHHSTKEEIDICETKSISDKIIISELKHQTISKSKTRQEFLNRLGFLESSGDYSIANKFNYVGKYQFGKLALKEIGYTPDHIDSIRASIHLDSTNHCCFNTDTFPPKEQEIAIRKFMHIIEYRYMKNYINKYDGVIVDSVKITKAGMLAAAHLRGSGSIKKFLDSNGNINQTDAFGTSVRNYLEEFENYNMNKTF